MDSKSKDKDDIRRNYDQKADNTKNVLQRETGNTYELKAFNNWIKSVLINVSTSKMCRTIQQALDLRKGDSRLLHVLDIGCGRGQDIKKWRLSRVSYMVAIDFSEECIKTYEERWRQIGEPYRLLTVAQDFTSRNLYSQIEHSYYDIVSAQLCFHYMLGSEEGLRNGLTSILSNLLIGGAFIATIPDSYTILKKVKEKGVKQADGYTTYGNAYFSLRFRKTQFQQPFGNQYGFYLEEAIGQKSQSGEINYTSEWLIELESLEKILLNHGVRIQETMNFLDFYNKYKQQYKDLFAKFKLTFQPGQSMNPELWEIAHLYRVVICRKTAHGKSLADFDLKARQQSISKQLKRTMQDSNQRGGYRGHYNSHHSHGGHAARGSNRGGDHFRGREHDSRSRDYDRSRNRDNRR